MTPTQENELREYLRALEERAWEAWPPGVDAVVEPVGDDVAEQASAVLRCWDEERAAAG